MKHTFITQESAFDFASQQGGDYVRIFSMLDPEIILVTTSSTNKEPREQVIYEGHPDAVFDIPVHVVELRRGRGTLPLILLLFMLTSCTKDIVIPSDPHLVQQSSFSSEYSDVDKLFPVRIERSETITGPHFKLWITDRSFEVVHQNFWSGDSITVHWWCYDAETHTWWAWVGMGELCVENDCITLE